MATIYFQGTQDNLSLGEILMLDPGLRNELIQLRIRDPNVNVVTLNRYYGKQPPWGSISESFQFHSHDINSEPVLIINDPRWKEEELTSTLITIAVLPKGKFNDYWAGVQWDQDLNPDRLLNYLIIQTDN